MYSCRAAVVFLVATCAVAQPVKRPIEHRDYDAWRTIQSQALSRDGKFLAYAVFPEDGDGEVVVRNLATGKEARQNAGAMPLTPPPPNPETGEPAPPRGVRLLFTHDGRFLIAGTFPARAESEKAKRDRRRPDEAPRGGMLIFDLSAMTAARVNEVTSFQVPESGADFVAYLKAPKIAEAAQPARNDQDSEVDARQRDQRLAGPARGNRPGGEAAELILRDLTNGRERAFEDVVEYSLSKDAGALVYAVSSKREEMNGVYDVAPGSDAAPVMLLGGKGRYADLTWDLAQRQFAFLSNRDDVSGKPAKFKAYLWNRQGAPVAIASVSSPGFRAGYAIDDRAPIAFSRDGSRLFLNCAPAEEVAALDDPPAPAASDAAVLADLWSWKDDYIQPMQKVRAAQERSRAYRAVIHLADRKFVQLSDPSMIQLVPSDDGDIALGADDRVYRHMVDYDGTYNDIYLVNTETGARRMMLKAYRGNIGGGRGGVGNVNLSPDGRRVLAYKEKQWWSIDTSDGSLTNLTAKLGPAFYVEDHDTPDEPPAYGSAGWTRDGKWALVYDRYDVWAVAPDGAVAHKLTSGRPSGVEFRVVRLDDPNEEEERGVDESKPLLLRAENLETRDTGFYSLTGLERGQPQKLIMGPRNYRVLGKAKDADVLMITATTFRDEPDIHITDSSFRHLRKVTDANPQQAQLLWGSGELIHYRNTDGVDLEAALYKPENFDPSKKYPMLIYIYEKLTQNVHNFVRPAPGTSINIAYYVSNGYLVLTPDIVYKTGYPGQSALQCVLPAIETVVEKGYVNRDAIGIQGHSWGGYQTAYMLTQTNLFRAAEAGAPVADMISAYDGIRWGSGLPRQFQYEKTQSRIGGTLWQYPLRFIENSPVFMADRITTPLLILENDGDDAVPWYQGLEMFLSLRRLGKEAYLWNYNGEPHGLRRRPQQKDYTVRMQEFFDHFLKGAPEPDWMQHGIRYIDREQEKRKITAIYSGTSADGKK